MIVFKIKLTLVIANSFFNSFLNIDDLYPKLQSGFLNVFSLNFL